MEKIGLPDGFAGSRHQMARRIPLSQQRQPRPSQDKGELVEIAKVKESGIRVGAIFSAKLAALVNDASGALAGLGESELRKKLHERTQGILAEIRDELEKA